MAKNKTELQLKKEALEDMRIDLQEIEMRARFWKAKHDVSFYTLAAEKLQPEYDEWLRASQEKQNQLQREYEEKIELLKQESQLKVEEV